jgi:FixJ family two-component response regulator
MSIDYEFKKKKNISFRKENNKLIHEIHQPLHCLQLFRSLINNQKSIEEAQLLFERLDFIILDFKNIISNYNSSKKMNNSVESKNCKMASKVKIRSRKEEILISDKSKEAISYSHKSKILKYSVEKKEKIAFTVSMIDDDELLINTTCELIEREGFNVRMYRSGEEFLEQISNIEKGCVIIDQQLPGMNGITLIKIIKKMSIDLPLIMVTGFGDIKLAVNAMRAGAVDFAEKPFEIKDLILKIENLSEKNNATLTEVKETIQSHSSLQQLTKREIQILDNILSGCSNKVIARKLNISHRTVENHRASIMKKTKAKSLMELARLTFQLV